VTSRLQVALLYILNVKSACGQSPVEEFLRTVRVFTTPLGLGQRRTAPTATPREF